jgi:uncharacterized repeat protein (TIGR03803 family)
MKFPGRQNPSQNISRGAVAGLAITLFATLAAPRPALAQTETVLHNFCASTNCADGANPGGGMVMDSSGNLYGTTYDGGLSPSEDGVVFKLSLTESYSTLYIFGAVADDGADPEGQLALDNQGNLYGTTVNGGSNNTSLGGDGTVFKLSPDGTETLLYNFGANATDGIHPRGGVVMDAEGNLYGTTIEGGVYALGTVFRVTPEGVETILHSFAQSSTDGGQPFAGLTIDQNGNLYGTTRYGGSADLGTVFEVTAEGSYSVLHSFAGQPTDGSFATAGLTLDGQGNIYGAAFGGGAHGSGMVFELTPGSNGSWQETVLFNFPEQMVRCQSPFSNVLLDGEGNLYGTTYSGGAYGYGCIYSISSEGTLTILHTFGEHPDGSQPFGNVLFSGGDLYGTTEFGGTHSGGTVFKFKP